MSEALPSADAVCDGGDLDCGSGLLLMIRNAMTPIEAGGVLEVRSRETSVREDLPAWCRMVGHALLGSVAADERTTRYLIRKKGADSELAADLAQAKDHVWRTRVRWKEGMRADAYVRNHSFPMGQPASFDTEDAAPSAIEYLLSSLAGCLAVGFAWRASRQGIEVHDLEVSLRGKAENILVFLGIESEGDPGLASIEGKLFVDCDAEEEARVQALWEETLLRSPVARSLLRAVELKIEARRSS